MQIQNKLKNWLILFCFAILSISFLSSISMNAQDKENDTKKKEDEKSDQVKSNNEIEQKESKEIEVIQPPKGEQWYEPGDEEIYTLKLNIQKPKEGITGGKLIYYGVYIEPPYKVEVKDHSIFVNGINISTSPEGLLDRIHQRDQTKKEDYVPKLSIEEIKMMDYADKLRKIIKLEQEEIFNKYNRDYESNAVAMDKEFREYLQSNPEIVIFNYYDFRNVFVRFRLPNGKLSAMYLLSCYCRSAKQKEARDLMWENQFNNDYKELMNTLHSSVYACDIGVCGHELDSTISGICGILQQKISREQKIAKIYLLLNESIVSNAKLYYYNFNPIKFGCVESDNEKK